MPLSGKLNSVLGRIPAPSWLLLAFAGLGLSVTGYSLSEVGERTRKAAAIQNAMILSQSVRVFRTLYSEEVVSKLDAHGLKATHESGSEPGSFALPKDLSLRLATEIGAGDLEATTKLYSPYPFPWNTDKGLPDEFSAKAWAQLSADPTTPVQKYETRGDRIFLRYATADTLDKSCIGCHNSYPGTPRHDWKAGDLRGVLEVNLPLDRQIASAGLWTFQGVYLFSFLSALFIVVAGLSVLASQRASRTALRESRRYQMTSNELQDAIVERELAEKENRHLENQIQHAQKLESFNLMVGGIAHDFNNLLLPIVANTDILRERIDTDPVSLEVLDEVDLAATKASDLCSQMLTYSGKSGPTERVPLDLSNLLEETGRLLKASLGPACKLEADLCQDLPLIEADQVQISQIALNLIKNASEAIGDTGGTIRLRTGRAGLPIGCEATDTRRHPFKENGFRSSTDLPKNHASTPGVFLEVADDGIGMSAETVGKVFDPFFSTKFTGRGLGLAAVQGIVRSHRGSIVINSEPGSHTVVRITFPVADAGASVGERNATRALMPGEVSGTILLAEDDDAVQAVAKRMLEDAGFKVVIANDGESAIWRFSREPDRYIALFFDLTMPRMDGLRALKAIRKIRPDIPAILCSGYSERINELKDIQSEKTLFIRKPFRSQSLREKLYTLLVSPQGVTTTDQDRPTHPSSPPNASSGRFTNLPTSPPTTS